MFLLTAATSLILVFSQWRAAAGATHPATVSQAASSIALQLHYPPKERAAQKQGAVKFYCEVSPEGKAAHITTLCGKGEARFETAVQIALRHGRFNPASVDGKPVSVMLGGTVVFLLTKGQPTIAITLATAELDKVSAMTNYVQPQMIETDALFRRKIFALRDKYPLRFTRNPGAVVRVHVDAEGKMVSRKIESEAPPSGGYGRLLLDVADEEKFIPAQSNGQAVAGDFELVADFGHMRNPDGAPDTGTLLKNDGY